MKTITVVPVVVAADMKLEQSIQRLKKVLNHHAYVNAWKLAYHKVLSIAKVCGKISKSVLANTDTNLLHKELRN